MFRRCHGYIVTLGKSLDMEPNVPGIAGRQIHRANASASTPFDYYLRNMWCFARFGTIRIIYKT